MPGQPEAGQAARAEIFFCDKSGIRSDYLSGTTWAAVADLNVGRGAPARLTGEGSLERGTISTQARANPDGAVTTQGASALNVGKHPMRVGPAAF